MSPLYNGSLLGSTNFLGLRLQGNEVTVNTTIASLEQAQADIFSPPPTITVTFSTASVPEPSTLTLAGLGVLIGAGTWWRKRAA